MVRPGTARRSLLVALAFALGGLASVAPASPVAAPADASSTGGPSGAVVAWGDNTYGQTTVPSTVANVKAITVGNDHAVAIRADGVPVPFGRDFSNNLAVPPTVTTAIGASTSWAGNVFLKPDGTVVSYSIPAPAGLAGVKAVCAGLGHAVALKSDGTLVTWGANSYHATEMPAGITNVTAIACGMYHTLALKADGTVIGWGNNSAGQVSIPAGLSNVVAIATGDAHSLALKADGTVTAWGWNTSGESTVPAGLTNVIQVAAGNAFSVALLGDGTVTTWGDNSHGQRNVPGGLGYVTAIAAGGYNAAAIVSSAAFTIAGWGGNGSGQVSVPTIYGAKVMAAGWGHTLVITSDGKIAAFGGNIKGETTVPAGLTGVTKGVAAGNHSLGLKTNGAVVGWGFNYSGQVTIPVAAQSGVKAIAAGAYHSLALKADGTVVAWGANTNGETNVPAGLTNVIAISAGYNFNAALKADGTIVTWGDNTYGQLAIPGGLAPATEVAAGGRHVVVRFGDGTIGGWGSNTEQQLTAPAGGGWIGLAAGYLGTYGIRSDGTLAAWGDNSQHQAEIPAGMLGVTGVSAGWYDALAFVPRSPRFSVSGFRSPTIANAAHTFTVRALDSYGNTISNYAGTVHLSSSDGQAVLPVDYAFTPTDAGVHVFTARLRTAGTQYLRASDPMAPSVVGSQSNITVQPSTFLTLSVSGFANPTIATVQHSFQVRAVDAYGNTVPGYTGTVHFSSSDLQATLPANYTFVSGDNSAHTFTARLRTIGTQWLRASDTVNTGSVGTQTGIVVKAGPITRFVLLGFRDPTIAGASHSFTLRAVDSLNNTVTDYAGTVHFTSSDPQAVLPPDYTFMPGDLGVHTFTAKLKTAGSQSIRATDTTTPTLYGMQAGIGVSPDVAKYLTVTGYPNPATAGASQSITVTARDAYGNTAASYTGTVHFTSSDPQAVLPANSAFTSGDAGVRVFSVSLRTAGTQSIRATDTVTATITGSQSGLVVTPGAAASFTVTGYPNPGSAGAGGSVTVKAYDAWGNVATGYRGTVHFTTSDAAASLPADHTFTGTDAGVHTFTLILNTVGSQWIRATDTVTASITGVQTGIALSPE